MSQLTTITFFRFNNFKDKFWALSQMYYAHATLKAVEGLEFYKLMGSGRGDGFKILPDLQVFCLLQVWQSEAQAELFFSSSKLWAEYTQHSAERWTIYMTCISARGSWSGRAPFQVVEAAEPAGEQLVVITRASIRLTKLLSFWKFVPHSHPAPASIKGLLYTKGVGEVPLLQMATVSLWRNMADMKAFAYGSAGHLQAMKKKSELKWYKDELFARFVPYRFSGSWQACMAATELSPLSKLP